MIKRKLDSPRSCKNCAVVFQPRMDLTRRNLGIFCSTSCSNIFRRGKLEISREELQMIYKKEGSIHKTAKALRVGWKITYRTLKELKIDTSGRSRQQSTYETCYNSDKKRIAKHTLVAIEKYGRNIQKEEVVHHIDGNRQNNNRENLIIMTRIQHSDVHRQLDEIAYFLIQKKLIIFKENGGYIISPKMEMVLDGE